jgi:hypothetical protein
MSESTGRDEHQNSFTLMRFIDRNCTLGRRLAGASTGGSLKSAGRRLAGGSLKSCLEKYISIVLETTIKWR